MKLRHSARAILLAAAMVSAAGAALAQDAAKKPHVPLQKTIGQVTPTGPEPSLAVINSGGAKIEGDELVLTGVTANTIVFADRPVRAAGHVTTEQFIMQWDEGKDSFAIDPPNATVSVLGGDGSDVSDAVVTLKSAKLEGTTLTFKIALLEGTLKDASGPAALFIDFFAAHYSGPHGGGVVAGGYHGGAYYHAPVYHGAWYSGAAVAGAAVAGVAVGAAIASHPYYPPPPTCGYYPYPPCY